MTASLNANSQETDFTRCGDSATLVRCEPLVFVTSGDRPSAMRKIETNCARVPWSWVGWMTCPWIVYYFVDNITGGGPLLFTMRKFIVDPAQIGFLTSLKVGFNFVIGVAASYLSDRVWTRWGRRRPFLIVGWMGAAAMMLLFPFARSAASLVPLIIGFQLAQSIAKPLEPLCNDIIPAHQRGRAATVHLVAQNLIGLLFYGVLVAQFDRSYSLVGDIQVSGEAVLYWIAAGATLAVVALLLFGVREKPPLTPPARDEFGLAGFVRGVFGERQWWMIYLLYAAPLLAGVSTENFTALTRTEQLGFSKQQLGWLMSGGIVAGTLIAVPVAGYLTDRVSRLRLYQVGIAGPAVVNLTLFVYLRTSSTGISFPVLVAFTLVGGMLQACLWTVWGPLAYDYIPRHRFGTVSAGLAFVGGLVPFVVLNVAGFWISNFTKLFGRVGAGPFDYSSIYVLNALGAVAACGIIWWFEREEKRGRVIAWGRPNPSIEGQQARG